MSITSGELADWLGGELLGPPEALITGVASLDNAAKGDVVLADTGRYAILAAQSDASCVIAGLDSDAMDDKSVIRVQRPGEAFIKVLELFKGEEALPEVGIGPQTTVGRGAKIGLDARIGANCCVGSGAEIGDGSVLFANVCVGDGVKIGRDARIYPGAVIYAGCEIGDRVIVHSGAVIGADGFGYLEVGGRRVKIPHCGRVVVEDDVEIGANSTIDRAKTGVTRIGAGTKIDNLVHIAHNVTVGRNCVIVALSGIAGRVWIGDNVTLAAQTGVKDHVTIEDNVIVAARGCVIGDIRKGSVISGYPARDRGLDMKAEAVRLRLPDILERLRALERHAKLFENCAGDEDDDSQR